MVQAKWGMISYNHGPTEACQIPAKRGVVFHCVSRTGRMADTLIT